MAHIIIIVMGDHGYAINMMALLLATSVIYLNAWDFITTVHSVYEHGAYELNPSARELLESGDLITLAFEKAVFSMFMIGLLLGAVTLYNYGVRKDSTAVKSLGAALLLIFEFLYIAMLIILTLNYVAI